MPYQSEKLSDYSKEELKERCEELKDCQENVENIIETLKVFEDTEVERIVDGLKKIIQGDIAQIENTNGYQAFVALFGIEWTEEGVRELPPFAEVAIVLEKSFWPQLPWPFMKSHLYTNEVEAKYEEMTIESNKLKISLNNERFKINKEIIIDPIHEATINKMMDPSFIPRAHELFKLYILNHFDYLSLNDDAILFNDVCENKEEIDINKKDAKEEIKKRFESYYKSIYQSLKQSIELPIKIDPKDPDWEDLIIQAINLRNKIITLKKTYSESFKKYLRIVNDDLVHEYFNFLVFWNLPIKNRHLSARQLQKHKGGAGLSRKIKKMGLEKFQKLWEKFLLENKLYGSELKPPEKGKQVISTSVIEESP